MGPRRQHSLPSPRRITPFFTKTLFINAFLIAALPAPPWAGSALAAGAASVAGAVSDGADADASAEEATAPADSDADGETPRFRLDPVVITAERMPLPLARIPADVTVISRERLDRERPYFLADALREAPGIDVQRAGALGKITDVRLRGADPRHTLVLFDGIPLNGPWLGSFDFADLMGDGTTQVEIFGGPASSLYGSGAVGGVIHVVSPPASGGATGGRPAAFAEFGEDRTFRQGLRWQGGMGRGSSAVSLGRLTSDGRVARDGYDGMNGRVHLDWSTGGDRARLSAIATQGTKELPYDFTFDPSDTTLSPFGSLKQVRDPNIHERDRVLAGGASYVRELNAHASLEAELSGFFGQIKYHNDPNPPSSSDRQRTRLDNVRGIAAVRARLRPASGQVQAVLGGEYRTESVDRLDDSNFGGFASASRVEEGVLSRALYAQTHVEWGGLVLLDTGIRLEDHSRYGAYGVPRIGLGLLVTRAGLKLRGAYGRAFTAPTLTDLFYPGYGSPGLKPERSRTWEAGVDGSWLKGAIVARSTWHTTRFRDLIQSNSFFVADNVGRARIEGEEVSMRVAPDPRISLGARGARLHGTNLVTGERLAKRPRWRGGVSVEGTPARGVAAFAEWWWAGSMLDPFVFVDVEGRAQRGDTPERASLDLGANLSLERWVPADLRLRLSNALDRGYSDVKGFPARGRAFAIGFTLNP